MITVLYFCHSVFFILVNVCFIVNELSVFNINEWIECFIVANESLRYCEWLSALIKHVTCQQNIFLVHVI